MNDGVGDELVVGRLGLALNFFSIAGKSFKIVPKHPVLMFSLPTARKFPGLTGILQIHPLTNRGVCGLNDGSALIDTVPIFQVLNLFRGSSTGCRGKVVD